MPAAQRKSWTSWHAKLKRPKAKAGPSPKRALLRSAKPTRSRLEQEFANQIHLAGLPEPLINHHFCEGRKWELDFAFLPQKVCVEVQGGIWTGGAHVSGKGYTNNREKMNQAMLLGWKCLEVCPKHIKSGQALKWLEQAFDAA